MRDVPSEWREGYIIKLPQKSDVSCCSSRPTEGWHFCPYRPRYSTKSSSTKWKMQWPPMQLEEQQPVVRKDRSYTDQIIIVTLRITLDQSVEWKSPMYTNFIDYEKAFDRLDRETLWRPLKQYGASEKIANIIRNSYVKERRAGWSMAVNSATPSKCSQELSKVPCCHPSCSCWPPTGLCENQQNKRKRHPVGTPNTDGQRWVCGRLGPPLLHTVTDAGEDHSTDAVNSARLALNINVRESEILQIAALSCWRTRRWQK